MFKNGHLPLIDKLRGTKKALDTFQSSIKDPHRHRCGAVVVMHVEGGNWNYDGDNISESRPVEMFLETRDAHARCKELNDLMVRIKIHPDSLVSYDDDKAQLICDHVYNSIGDHFRLGKRGTGFTVEEVVRWYPK